MEATVMILGGVAGILGGMFAGLSYGRRLRSRPAFAYWVAVIGIMAIGIVISTLGLALGSLGLAVAGVGVAGGGLTGIKYGSGRVMRASAHQDNEKQDR